MILRYQQVGVIKHVYKNTAVIEGIGLDRKQPTNYFWMEFTGGEADTGRPVQFTYYKTTWRGKVRNRAINVRFTDSDGDEHVRNRSAEASEVQTSEGPAA
jgi:hypothetical protein